MPQDQDVFPFRTIILFVIIVPIIAYLLFFAYRKNTESEQRAFECQSQCTVQGFPGHNFQWSVFSGPQCECFGEVDLNLMR